MDGSRRRWRPGVAVLVLVLFGAGALGASPARATITFFMEWTSTSSDEAASQASLGTPDYVGKPGDQVALTLYVGLDEGEWLSTYGVSVEWDQDFGDELDLLSVSEEPMIVVGGAVLRHITPSLGAIVESDIETIGTVRTFEAFTLGPALEGGPSTSALVLGTLQFELTDWLETDGLDVFVGFFDVGIDGAVGCPPVPPAEGEEPEECIPEELVFALIDDRVALEGASVSSVPEPQSVFLAAAAVGTLAMLRARRLRAVEPR